MENLEKLSVRELETLLLQELNNVEKAKSRFNSKKVELSLNFKRIDPKVTKISTLIDLTYSNEAIKSNLIKRIMTAREEVKRIDALFHLMSLSALLVQNLLIQELFKFSVTFMLLMRKLTICYRYFAAMKLMKKFETHIIPIRLIK